jgi:D-sedoheptulose 7-phosphate isomerase
MDEITKLADAVVKAKRVYIIGNGGSAANANHIANDLVSCGIRAHALTDVATLTAIANDISYGAVFSHQLKVFAEPGDLLLALSGSGTSKNIVQAIDEAKKIGMETMLITRYLRGKDMQASEEEQLELGHEVMKCLKDS